MGEKSVIAYFKTPEDAQEVGKQLKAMGADEVQVDQFGFFPGSNAEELLNPFSSRLSTQGDLVFEDLSIRGISEGGFDSISGRNTILTAVMDESLYSRALHTVRQAGGLA